MHSKFDKIIHSPVIIRLLSLFVLLSGIIVSMNGLIYSNINITIEGSILFILGIVIFLTFDPKISDFGLIILPNRKRRKQQ